MNKVVFIMGVSGSGKSSVGELLAKELSIPFMDADDYHPTSNIEKMSGGVPLNDEDRLPWLKALNQIAQKKSTTGCVIACSALKEDYRIQLAKNIESKVLWIYLKGSYKLIFERMMKRQDHFMDVGMLKSQFETLEEPQNVITIDIEGSLESIIQIIYECIK